MFAAIVLAAGQSKRMGQNKMLMRFGVSSVLETVVSTLGECDLNDILVVTGHEREQVEQRLRECPVRLTHNPDYASGEMLSSIQTGLRAMQAECQAALLALGDQPLIQVEVVRRVLAAQQPNTIVIPSFQRKRGHPILIDRALWPAVLRLPPGSNLREMINAHADQIRYVEVDTDTIIRDLDTPEDYQQATRQ